jgi:hypothetical protein
VGRRALQRCHSLTRRLEMRGKCATRARIDMPRRKNPSACRAAKSPPSIGAEGPCSRVPWRALSLARELLAVSLVGDANDDVLMTACW